MMCTKILIISSIRSLAMEKKIYFTLVELFLFTTETPIKLGEERNTKKEICFNFILGNVLESLLPFVVGQTR